ncbi:MAG: zf-HC2 domain-containing protein [Planctomycetota bacterium]|nr:MAG: zf-HC2 domain-containing protein [Planctomycetota bacterium]
MGCIGDTELIAYISGGLTQSARDAVQKHISECEGCGRRVEEMAELWDVLGEWGVEAGGHEVADRIEAVSATLERPTERKWRDYVFREGVLPASIRIASSIIIAVGVGNRLGEWSIKKAQAAEEAPEYLSSLRLEWSSGVTQSALADTNIEGDKEK